MEQKTMKAVMWNGKPFFDGLSYGDFPVPKLKKDWVLVRNIICGICGSDMHFFSGAREGRFPEKNLPAVFGHETASIVVEAGPETGYKPGERVAAESIHSCASFGKSCGYCNVGDIHVCEERSTVGLPYMTMIHGGYGEFSLIHKDKLHRLPGNVSMEHAALLDIVSVNVHAVMIGQPKLGDICAVMGCGVIGLSLVQVLKAHGMANIIAICKYPFQAEIAKKSGASDIVMYADETVVGDVLKLTDGKGADQIYECVGGSANSMNMAVKCAARKGKVIMMGAFDGEHMVDLNTMFKREISILPANSYAWSGHRNEFDIAIDMVAHNQVDNGLLISHRFKPEEYVDAINAMRGKGKSKAVKILFVRD